MFYFKRLNFSVLSGISAVIVLILCFILCVTIIERYQLASGFSMLSGDKYDAVIVATILEHWFNVLLGHNQWSQVGYFYPYSNTIAQTDAYFLIGMIYSPLRTLGLDPFIATEMSSVILKAIGFFSGFVLCKHYLKFSYGCSLLIAVLFTLNNAMTLHGQRLQLATVAFFPLMGILMWESIAAFLSDRRTRFLIFGIISGFFFGSWCLTCFYMAWFFTFFSAILLITMFFLAGKKSICHVVNRIKYNFGSVLLVFFSFAISLVPFISAFLPKSHEVGVRTYESAVLNTVPVEGILQVGKENILFGRFYNYLLSYVSPHYVLQGEYSNTGVNVFLFSLFALGGIYFLNRGKSSNEGFVLKSIILATLVTWMFVINVNGHSAWFFIYTFFPGAKALNVISAYQILLALPVILIAVGYLVNSKTSLSIMLLISFVLIAGELNVPYVNLNRSEEINRINIPELPPKKCVVFYVSGWSEQHNDPSDWINNYYDHNVSAMLISQIIHIPTVNGIASFNPPDWNFGFPNNYDYNARVLNYAKKHNLDGLCRLDLENKKWSFVD